MPSIPLYLHRKLAHVPYWGADGMGMLTRGCACRCCG